ncbi:6-phosphofructokinase [Candidatus Auribacterota bacterium]
MIHKEKFFKRASFIVLISFVFNIVYPLNIVLSADQFEAYKLAPNTPFKKTLLKTKEDIISKILTYLSDKAERQDGINIINSLKNYINGIAFSQDQAESLKKVVSAILPLSLATMFFEMADIARIEALAKVKESEGKEVLAKGKSEAKNFGTTEEFIKGGALQANCDILEAKALGRVMIIPTFGSQNGSVALGIGAEIKAARTLIPEDGVVDLKKLIDDIKRYHDKYGYGGVVVADGIKIERNKDNEKYFRAAFEKDPVAKAIYEEAAEAGVNESGYLEFRDTARVLSALITPQLKIKSVTATLVGKIGYGASRLATKEETILGGQKADVRDKDKEIYDKANQALKIKNDDPEVADDFSTVSEPIKVLSLKEAKEIEKKIDKAAKSGIKRIGILTGGGLASGHNAVIAAVVERAAKQGIEVIGIRNGWAGLVEEKLVLKAGKIIPGKMKKHRRKGGSILGTSRVNPFSKDNIAKGVPETILDNIKRLGLDALFTCGGDDTNGAARELQKKYPNLRVVGLPKTMDNDILLPDPWANTYGPDSFGKGGGEIVKGVIADAKVLGAVTVVEAFGRGAGFAPLAVAEEAGGVVRTLIPEKITDLEELVADVKDFHKKHGYAAVVVSEGVKIKDDDKNKKFLEEAFAKDPVAKAAYYSGAGELDAYGHPKLKDTGLILTALLSAQLEMPVELEGKIDYAARSADTSDIDYNICSKVGAAAVEKVISGVHGCLLYVDSQDRVQEMELDTKLDGREVDVDGSHHDLYAAANQALALYKENLKELKEILIEKLKILSFSAKTENEFKTQLFLKQSA